MEATDATAWRDCNQGMTLRDYFAAKVLQGVMTSGTSMSIGTNHEEAMLDMARAFYSMADAMIKARELP
ncbi:hypothetical protein OJ478_001659 [Salmonella enterica subsp. enterica serovar Cerro]|nr:hypothetical protein [Salmonella enterica subsp. enterica serovar Cerro]